LKRSKLRADIFICPSFHAGIGKESQIEYWEKERDFRDTIIQGKIQEGTMCSSNICSFILATKL